MSKIFQLNDFLFCFRLCVRWTKKSHATPLALLPGWLRLSHMTHEKVLNFYAIEETVCTVWYWPFFVCAGAIIHENDFIVQKIQLWSSVSNSFNLISTAGISPKKRLMLLQCANWSKRTQFQMKFCLKSGISPTDVHSHCANNVFAHSMRAAAASTWGVRAYTKPQRRKCTDQTSNW